MITRIKNMNEKKILFKNICNKMMNQFKYKKTELSKGSVFLYLFNCIGIFFFRRGSIHRIRNENGLDKSDPTSKATLYTKKVLSFKLTTNNY